MDFLKQEPTVSKNISIGMYKSILTEQKEWRCYNKNTLISKEELQKLIDRYIRAHATVPGIVTEETLSSVPILIFGFEEREAKIKGALWANGAVINIVLLELEHTMLFVTDKVARAWAYPDEYIRTTEYFSGSIQKENGHQTH